MKAKCLLGICLVLVTLTVIDCRKKSPPPQEESIQQKEVLEQPSTEQAAPDKPATEEPKMVEPAWQAEEAVSVKAGSEQTQPEETEYFAVFMEGKKAGYAINKRVVSESEVITSDELSLTLSRAGISMSVTMNTKIVETADGKPLGFECVQDLGLMKVELGALMKKEGVTWNNADKLLENLNKLTEAVYEIVSYLKFKEDQEKV